MKLNLCLLFLFLTTTLTAQYAISGRVNLSADWQPKIYLAAVNKLSDYYRTNPDMIVNTAEVDANGNFSLQGDNLPAEKRFYRLYLMKKQNTDYDACLYVGGDDHNFVHILLENGESVEINTDPASVAPFGEYEIYGQSTNQAMRELARIVFPSFYFYRIKFPTELKFSEDKLHTNLKQFADTCSFPLVALAAVNNTDFDEYFSADRAFYEAFGERLQREIPQSIYTKNYLLKLKYYANEDTPIPAWLFGIIAALSVFLGVAVWQMFQYRNRLFSLEQQLENQPIPNPTPALPSLDDLTQKEEEILQLICAKKSNKEIASELFVEVSTVKTHINKLYAKLGVSNRKQAQSIGNQIFTKKV
ncbi:MAG: response regulator transcription factor [Saprospiraceae bacterium]